MAWYNFITDLFRKKPKKPEFRKPKSGASVCYVERSFYEIKDVKDLQKLVSKIKGASLRGKTINLNGAILDAKKLKGDGSQNENQEPVLKISLEGVTIENGFVRNVKDGMRANAPKITFKRLTFLDVGEDAINNGKESEGTRVIDCQFDNSKHRSADKSIQLNNGKNALVENCLIYGGITAIRMGDKWNDSNDTGKIVDTKFVGVDTAMNFAKIRVILNNNSFEGVKKQIVHSHGSRVV
jgi:hypothetical protein